MGGSARPRPGVDREPDRVAVDAVEGQAGVAHLTTWREQAPAVRLFLVPSPAWRQIRAPLPYKTEANLEIGQLRNRRGDRKG